MKWFIVIVVMLLLGLIIKATQGHHPSAQPPSQPTPPSLNHVCVPSGVNTYFLMGNGVWHIVCNDGSTTDIR